MNLPVKFCNDVLAGRGMLYGLRKGGSELLVGVMVVDNGIFFFCCCCLKFNFRTRPDFSILLW